MKFFNARDAVFLFTFSYLVVFGALFVSWGDGEYIWYTALILSVGGVLWYFLRDIDIPIALLLALSLAGLMHFAGRMIFIDGDVLYKYHLLTLLVGSDPEAYVLKYDQLVHFYGYAVAALTVRNLLMRIEEHIPLWARVMMVVLIACGIGALNEIGEFVAVVTFHHTYVGNYYNIGLDLVANLAGAVFAVAIAEWWTWHRSSESALKNSA